MIDIERVHLEYYDPRVVRYEDLDQCGSQCASCGQCRDCGICVAACPESAISRTETADGRFEYVVTRSAASAAVFAPGRVRAGFGT
jgi:ferredoxin